MKLTFSRKQTLFSGLFIFLILFPSATDLPAAEQRTSAEQIYTQKSPSRDGTGRYYMGREIAQVMGYPGAVWLERSSRKKEERPDLLLKALDLKQGDAVADIGAGTGYYSRRMARQVGPGGTVYAVDIQAEMLQLLVQSLQREKIANVKPVLSTETNPGLTQESIDLALMVDVYHEFSHPYEMLQALSLALKPGGRLVFVEYRAEDPDVPIKPLHKMSEEQIKREASVHPLKWEKTVSSLPWQHIIIFRKE